MELFDKLFLTTFRIVAVTFIIYYLFKIVRNAKFATGYVACVAFVLAGALGNLIDSMFYGEIFTDSNGRVAQLVEWGNGYGDFLYGQVVDMFYFPLFGFDWPQWMPFVGGEHFIFFSPIFNFADACVSCGKCESLCVLNNISIQDGKPKWGNHCTHCMACICGCPAEAIEYGKKSLGKPRYWCDEYQK